MRFDVKVCATCETNLEHKDFHKRQMPYHSGVNMGLISLGSNVLILSK